MLLYHGSKKGIKGNIRPESRSICDFGTGFYTGDMKEQPIGLIAAWRGSRFYELECELDGLRKLEFGEDYESQIDWALYIGYHRMRQSYESYGELCKRYASYDADYDLISGLIANDKIYELIDEFFDGTICDRALIDGLMRARLGRQYVFKTESACSRIHIISDRTLTDAEVRSATAQNETRKNEMSGIISQLRTRYRRASGVKYYDELMEEWNA